MIGLGIRLSRRTESEPAATESRSPGSRPLSARLPARAWAGPRRHSGHCWRQFAGAEAAGPGSGLLVGHVTVTAGVQST
jgi:hypothetical protein